MEILYSSSGLAIVLAMIAGLLAASEAGFRLGRRHFVSTAMVALLVVLVFSVIIDLDRPRRGLIRVSQESMVNLKENLDGASDLEAGGK